MTQKHPDDGRVECLSQPKGFTNTFKYVPKVYSKHPKIQKISKSQNLKNI
ncbi:hypothetical protein KFK09_024084 [Dendrobium nobile]|uniref:Uncharacterized protein n=1 Tax=Dendrobium nobile TaxID=94219 RepID=A0A8T3AD34_DENNO|nr:hypothetical protein KFK09_024084 [Dendrobium nobile]